MLRQMDGVGGSLGYVRVYVNHSKDAHGESTPWEPLEGPQVLGPQSPTASPRPGGAAPQGEAFEPERETHRTKTVAVGAAGLPSASHHPSLVQRNERLKEFVCYLRAASVPN